MYFDWLQRTINNSDDTKYKVKINTSIQQYPLSYIKRLNAKSTPCVFHVCDIESNSMEDTNRFHKIIDQLKEAKDQKSIEYSLGYSNLTFELWMILHKMDLNKSFTDKAQYLPPINSVYNEDFNSLKSYKEARNFARCLSKLNLSDVKDAIGRAKKISQNNKEIGSPTKSYKGFRYYSNNPSLSVWEIVSLIINECLK